MDNKDKLGLELKSIMDEDTRNINLSPSTIDKILGHRRKGSRERIIDFLNKEIEIPLAPAIIGLAGLLIITSVPKDIFNSQNIKIIDIGSSQVIVREKEVAKR